MSIIANVTFDRYSFLICETPQRTTDLTEYYSQLNELDVKSLVRTSEWHFDTTLLDRFRITH